MHDTNLDLSNTVQKTFNVVVADPLHSTGLEILTVAPDVDFVGPYDCDVDLTNLLSDADALIICSDTNVDAAILSQAPNLKIVARAGSRLDNVDIDEATSRGIFVTHVPDANVDAVVEYAFLLMLVLARKFGQPDVDTIADEHLGFQLLGKNLGIIGFGRHGREVAVRAQAFGMHVLAYDPYIDLSFARERGVEIVNYPELLARSDILTLHTAYTPHTHHILNGAAFEQLKPGAYLINGVHSGLVDEAAMLAALDAGSLSGAALDTWDQQSTPNASLVAVHPKILVTPNRNQATFEAYSNTAISVVTNMLAALRGTDYQNIVNLPFTAAASYQTVKQYIDLAVKLGKLQGQLTDGWITRVEVELLGDGLRDLVRQVTAVLLSGMIRSVDGRPVNWVSAPVLAYEQGVVTAQYKNLVDLRDYPTLIACRVHWEGGHRTVAGALFGNGEARLVHYDGFEVDAYPDGYVLILENDDVPGVIGKAGSIFSREKINIAQWRYGRERPGGQAVSFINLDQSVPRRTLAELEQIIEIRQARLVRL
jgi:D-3-phosphoglycerate dehydrogenase / 2-oxoglutarate reductase